MVVRLITTGTIKTEKQFDNTCVAVIPNVRMRKQKRVNKTETKSNRRSKDYQ